MHLQIIQDFLPGKILKSLAARFHWLNARLSAGLSFHLKKREASGA
jgi:hypothetical protein